MKEVLNEAYNVNQGSKSFGLPMRRLTFLFGLVSLLFVFNMPSALGQYECGTYIKPVEPYSEYKEFVMKDRFGNPYEQADLLIPENIKSNTVSCDCETEFGINTGVFKLYFEDCVLPNTGLSTNMGFADPSTIVVNGNASTVGKERRKTACQVYAYLNSVLHTNTNASCTNTAKVNVRVQPSMAIPNYEPGVDLLDIQAGAAPGVIRAGYASAYYFLQRPFGGLEEGMVWRVINTGATHNGFYHSIIRFNFNVVNSSPMVNFYTDATGQSAIGANQTDLYSTILHEAIHTLDFASAISKSGNGQYQSWLSNSTHNSFTRLDAHIFTTNNTTPLILPSTTGTPLSLGADLNPALNLLSSPNDLEGSCGNISGSTPLAFMPGNYGITAANPFSNGTSLSHIHDGCGSGSAGQTFVMHPGTHLGSLSHRRLSTVELKILENLGYQINPQIFPTEPNYNYPSPTSNCSFGGVDDGINFMNGCSNSDFTLQACSGESFTFTVADLIANDMNVGGISNLDIVQGVAGATLVNNGNGSYTFTPVPEVPFRYALRYIPTPNMGCNSMQVGNATYVFIRVTICPTSSTNCQFSSNMSTNDGFANNNCNIICNPEMTTNDLCSSNSVFGYHSTSSSILGWVNLMDANGNISLPSCIGNELPGWEVYGTPLLIVNPNNTGITVPSRYIENTAVTFGQQRFGADVTYQRRPIVAGRYFASVFNQNIPITNNEVQNSTFALFKTSVLNDLNSSPGITNQGMITDSRILRVLTNSVNQPTLGGILNYNNLINRQNWVRRVSCFNTTENWNAFGLYSQPQNINLTFYYGKAYFEHPELVPDDFDSETHTILCGTQSVTLGGKAFCNLSDVRVDYTWTANGNVLLQYGLEQDLDGTLRVYTPTGTNAFANGVTPIIPSLVVSPLTTTVYQMNRTFSNGNNQGDVILNLSNADIAALNNSGFNSMPITVNVYSPQAATCSITASPVALYSNNTVTLSAVANQQAYHWSTGETTQSIVVSTPGTYTVTVSITCGGSQTCSIVVNTIPCVTTAAPNATFVNINSTVNYSSLFGVSAVGALIPTVVNMQANSVLVIDVPSAQFEALSEFVIGANAKIEVLSGNSLDIKGAYLHGCTQRWNGISVYGNATLSTNSANGTTAGNRAIIEDAETAIHPVVVGSAAPTLKIRNTIFRRNQIGIDLDAASVGTLFPTKTFYNNYFTGGALPLLPDATGNTSQKPLAGIRLSDYTNVFISGVPTGGLSYPVNTFETLNYGIYATNSNLTVANNYFNNIRIFDGGNTNITTCSGKAIYTRGTGTLRSLSITDIPITLTNIIDNSTMGIYAEGMNFQVGQSQSTGRVRLNNVEFGIYALNMNTTHRGTVRNTTINASLEGVRVVNVQAPNALQIADGTTINIDRTLGAPDLGTATPNSKGISLNGTYRAMVANSSTTNVCEIVGVYINMIDNTNGNTAIDLLNCARIRVAGNHLDLRPTSPAGTFFGIKVNGGNSTLANNSGSFIEGNFVTGRTQNATRNVSAICIENSTYNTITCNDVDNTDVGLNFKGTCTGSVILTNNMRRHWNGLYMNSVAISSTQGAYTNAGTTYACRGNIWNNPAPAGSFQAVHAATQPIYVSNSRFDVNNTVLPPTGGTYMPTNQASTTWFFSNPVGNTIGCGNSAMLQAPPPIIDPRDIGIATETYIPQLYTEGLIWQGGKELLEKLDLNPALLANNSLMLDFKDSMAYTPTQDYWEIQKAREDLEKGDLVQNNLLQYYTDITMLKTGELYLLDSIYTHDSTALNTLQYTTQKEQYETDLKAAQSAADTELSDKLALAEQQADDLAIDNALAPYEKQAEENLHKVNAIYLGSFAKQSAILDEADYVQLYEIATQCPYSGGEGVYQARALLAAIRQPVYDDIAACEQQTIDWKLMPVSLHRALSIQAVPNPASDEVTFYLEHSIPNETTQLSLYDALGKPVGNYTFSGNTLHCDISHLASGLYYYQAQVGTVSLLGKLSILKP